MHSCGATRFADRERHRRLGPRTITGNNAVNVLKGGVGNDILRGGDSGDILNGGAGGDELDGGAGIDTVEYVGATAAVSVDIQFLAINTGDASGDSFFSIENLVGTAFGDKLRGNAANNLIIGGGGGDTLRGRLGGDELRGEQGDDLLEGGASGDRLVGGEGVDTVSYASAGAGLIADFLASFGTNTGEAVGDTYVTVENVLGSAFNDDLRTDNLSNVITAGNGHDILNGRGGFDLLRGGAGNDTYILSDLIKQNQLAVLGYDLVSEAAGAGTDTVSVTAMDNPDTLSATERYTLGANIENGRIAGTLAFNLTGNALANVLTGNTGVNVLTGGDGGDTYVLTGLAKTDVLATLSL